MNFSNDGYLWIILIIIVLLVWGGNSCGCNNGCCCNNGCGCNDGCC